MEEDVRNRGLPSGMVVGRRKKSNCLPFLFSSTRQEEDIKVEGRTPALVHKDQSGEQKFLAHLRELSTKGHD